MVKAATKKATVKKPAAKKATVKKPAAKVVAPADPLGLKAPKQEAATASSTFPLTSSIPIPTRRQATTPGKYPFATMDVGQMFFMPGRSSDNFATYASLQTRKLAPKVFKTRTMYMKECPEGTEASVPVEIEPGKIVSMQLCDVSDEGAVKGVGTWRME